MSRGLPNNVKQCLEKSRDCALLAIETYNKPAIKFRTGGYVVLMIISWTSLFHAIFYRSKIKPYRREKDSIRFQTKDDDYCYWSLDECLQEYFKSDTQNPIRKNLEFFIPLRNKIEHKSLPQIDPDLFAECQAMLLNYDKILEKEFGLGFCIRESLSFSLQLFPSSENLAAAIKSNPDAKKVKAFIEKYRSTLTTAILESGQYSFKAFLLQVANHQSADALPIQFIKYDQLTDEEKENVSKFAVLVKEKEKPVSGKDLLLPSKVVKLVQKGLGNPKVDRNGEKKDKFNESIHTRLWKKYGVRPANGASNKSSTDTRYCIYNELSNQYGYIKSWVTFLIEKMNDENEYKSLYK